VDHLLRETLQGEEMGSTRRKFTKEFKQEAVRLLTDKGLSVAQVCRDLGIGENSLHRWKKEFSERGEQAFPGNGSPVEAELARLRRELETVKRERDILKRATIFFAQESQE
jgi:transposase